MAAWCNTVTFQHRYDLGFQLSSGNIRRHRGIALTGSKGSRDYTVVYDTSRHFQKDTAAGQDVIVLNTLPAVTDTLDRKAAVSSNRPRSIVLGIITGNLMLPFLNPREILVSPFSKNTSTVQSS